MTDASESSDSNADAKAEGSTPSNASNPARFVPFVVLGVILTVASLVFGSQMCATQHQNQLLRSGEPAVAEILEVVDTGNRYNRNPEVEFTLKVTPQTGEPYDAKITLVLDARELQEYERGAKLDVRYDAADPYDIAIAGLWEEGADAKADTKADAKVEAAPAPTP
ncbi:DUF3592 domain-containing protein [Paraliomyxa miuraensis]|uniref:DUF3592 domain-containing protein n=1 Tax=Paraliomyxa miuraensis TaxID=376150 RepID=UPI0022579EF7|nr:DUF3592 domain-containing protein [Paraliomyxa miuraensis]MCX4246560.1 DUF3592 domain-containing protein [Paraliomyxa miuraensis]